jgi:hypothetical protein
MVKKLITYTKYQDKDRSLPPFSLMPRLLFVHYILTGIDLTKKPICVKHIGLKPLSKFFACIVFLSFFEKTILGATHLSLNRV